MTNRKVGRPKTQIDYKMVEKLASIMATQEEIATFLDISVRTLLRNTEFCHTYKKGLDKARMSLRRKQFALADKNATMGIWLGKQYLGQKDESKIEMSGTLDNTVTIKIDGEEFD